MTPGEFKALREKANMTQGRLGDALGVSERQVQRWEAGDFPIPPPVERLLEIVNDPDFFRLRVARLMRGEDAHGDPKPIDEPKDPLADLVEHFNENLKAAREGGEFKVAARAVDPDDADPLAEQVATFNQRVAAARRKA